eukprot:1728389-Pleurochrysis_carterae.AAC.1
MMPQAAPRLRDSNHHVILEKQRAAVPVARHVVQCKAAAREQCLVELDPGQCPPRKLIFGRPCPECPEKMSLRVLPN